MGAIVLLCLFLPLYLDANMPALYFAVPMLFLALFLFHTLSFIYWRISHAQQKPQAIQAPNWESDQMDEDDDPPTEQSMIFYT